MKESKGYIYILTNPSFPDYVKIGYANNVERRLKELNRSECTPFAFRIYATYEVSSNLSDKKVHAIIDKLNPELRAIDRVNGKERVREFYAMSAEMAYGILDAIATINGFTDRLVKYKMSEEEITEEREADDIAAVAKERRQPFRFSLCGINPGEYIEWYNNPDMIFRVVDDRHIEYQGQEYTLSGLATLLTGVKWTVHGPKYYRYKGEWLNAVRARKEAEISHKSEQ